VDLTGPGGIEETRYQAGLDGENVVAFLMEIGGGRKTTKMRALRRKFVNVSKHCRKVN